MKTVSARYAQALFELSFEQNILDKVSQELLAVENLVENFPELNSFLRQSHVLKTQAGDLFKRLSELMKLSETTLNFLLLLARQGRQAYLKPMIDAFMQRLHLHQQMSNAHVSSAKPLSDLEREQLRQSLAIHFKKNITLHEKVVPNLMGGLVIDFEGFRIDTSIKTQLAQWQKEIRG